jgi:hypothetical protein
MHGATSTFLTSIVTNVVTTIILLILFFISITSAAANIMLFTQVLDASESPGRERIVISAGWDHMVKEWDVRPRICHASFGFSFV